MLKKKYEWKNGVNMEYRHFKEISDLRFKLHSTKVSKLMSFIN